MDARDEDEMQDVDAPPTVPSLTTPGLARAVEVAREVLRERGYSEDEIDAMLTAKPGDDFPSF